MSLSNKIIAISGAASGIGLATAQLLASQGAHVSLADSNADVISQAAALPGGVDQHMSTVLDVRNAQEVNVWIDATVKRFGRLDGAVNMAGVLTEAKPLVKTTDEEWERSWAVNVRGMVNCLRAEIKAMNGNGGAGSIVSPYLFINIYIHTFSSNSNSPCAR